MLDISWEWIDGYFSAVRNINLLSQAAAADSATKAAWISAGGSIGAAVAAAVAAGLSWRASSAAATSSIEAEKAALFIRLVDLLDKSSDQSIKVIRVSERMIQFVRMSVSGSEESITKYKDHSSRMKIIREEFIELTEGISDLLERIRSAASVIEVRERYEELVGVQAKIIHWGYELRKVEDYLEGLEARFPKPHVPS